MIMKTSTLSALLLTTALTTAALDSSLTPRDPNEKYWPNGRPSNLQKRSPAPQILGVKKMSFDQSEKFYPEYWIPGLTITDYYGAAINVTESQLPRLLKPAIRTALADTPESVLKVFKRQNTFSCPANHYRCSSINRPDFCCGNDEDCEIIPDGGIGDVGCCPKGQNCLGTVRNCGDKIPCSEEEGGGCCMNGFRCTVNGCIPEDATTTITTAVPTQTSTCAEGFYACPAELGGGCCRIGRACAVNSCPPQTTTTSTPTPTGTSTSCPEGYYSCPEEFDGGCCRVGRACGFNSCPPIDEDTEPTLVVGGTCPDGWYGCTVEQNGGCCPDGFDCGINDCPARGANTPAAEKQNVIPASAKGVVGSVCMAVGAAAVGLLGGLVL